MSDKGTRSQSHKNFHHKVKKPKSGGKQCLISSSMLLQKSSDGKALQGIYLTKKLEDQLQVRAQLLEVPQDATLTVATQQTNNIIREFSSANQADEYEKIVKALGHSAAVSFSASSPVYGDVTLGIGASKGDETKEILYLSTLKFSTIHLASYYFKSSELKLSNNSKIDLKNILKILRVQKADSPAVKEACKEFFHRYGSHANGGPIRFGADIRWKCLSKDFENSEINTVKNMHYDAIFETVGVSFSAGDDADSEVSMKNIKENHSTNCSKKTCLNTHLVVTRKGGPLEAANFSKWNEDLVTDNNTWIVTDRGKKLEAVWDIIKLNHNRELGDVIDVLKTTWESVTGLKATLNPPSLKVGAHSLQTVLETKAECNPQGESELNKNKPAHDHEAECNPQDESELNTAHDHDLFKKLSLSEHYPMGLSQKEALCVRLRPLEFSLNTDPTSFHDIPSLVLHKLMAYDHRCRSDLIKSLDEDDIDDNKIDDKKIHPVDILLALLICSDDFLRQDLFSRLAKCQLAVPFILPDPFTKQLSIPLWAMHSIIKNWKFINSKSKVVEKTCPIISHKMPIISFIRLGKHQERGVSKSKLLNDVISESHYDHFFHRDLAGGRSEVLLGKGLVDMCWYLPSGKPKDAFPDAITFLNLHGDARDYPQQRKFLSKISSMCFILLTEEDSFNGETISILKKFALSFGDITILEDTGKSVPKDLKSELSIIELTGKSLTEKQNAIQKYIKKKLQANEKTLEDHCNCESAAVQDCAILVDEHGGSLKDGLDLANGILNMVTSYKAKESSTKEELLPLQGDLWKEWALKNKEFYRQVHRGSKPVNIYTDEIKEEKQKLHQSQLKYIESLAIVMEEFITTLLKYGGPTNRIMRNYFLQSLKLGLSDFSRFQSLALRQLYHDKQIELREIQDKTIFFATKEQITSLNACQEKLKNIEKQLNYSNVFGLEHLLRELGQMYEAVSESSPIPGLSRLPEAVAELLIDGYPLELMDGDASHVPLHWVTAVITEVATKLGDPKVFVLSVLGLQSTGKSTMLNTVFGLQFNVSSGRCTRGAFMQLLPLDEQLKEDTSFSYVLIVDTEGLRTDELDSQKAHKRDNELATFVIGLADVTLINIYGEVSGDMDDILQTSIHAFLRMSQVIKYRRSCQFIYQNAEPRINTEVVRAKLTRKLDKFTADAAKETNVEGQYKTFNDVIKFNDTNDIHHFPGLWTGSPPMAPVNPGYSEAAQNLKYHLIKILKEPRVENMLFSSFKHKVSDLWEALLKENFVFSFKNTLEIITYKSLETQYSRWEWNIREEMLKWEQTAENAINTAEPNVLSEFVREKCDELNRHIYKLYADHVSKMGIFFNESKHGEILAQWKARFENKLDSLREDLKIHASSQCEQLHAKRLKFEKERDRFYKLMAEKVQEFLKQEQEKLHAGLRGGKLEPSQLELELEAKFNSYWNEVLDNLRYAPEDPVNVLEIVESVLFDHARRYDQIILQNTHLRGRDTGLTLIVENSHYTVQCVNQATDSTDCCQMKVQKLTEDILETAKNNIGYKTSLDSDFKSDYIQELLKALDHEIDKHQSTRYGNYSFIFTPKYKFDIYLSACSYAVVEFEKMTVSFRKKNDPWLFLEAEIKGPLFTRFKNQYYQKKAEEGIANSLCAHFERPIKTQVRKSLSSTIVGQMKNSEHHLKSKMALKVKILTDLYHEDHFDSYMVYVTNVKRCLEEKLQLYTIQYCDEIVPGFKKTRLQNLAKEEVSRLVRIIEVAVTKSRGDKTHFLVWLKAFCENVEIKSVLGVILNARDIVSGYDSESIQELNLNNVKLHIKERLPNLHGIFDKVKCESEMKNWEVKPHEFLMKELIGCTEQCPFCGEQCDLQDPDHEVNHRVAVHRSCCLGGFKDFHTRIMHAEFCTAKILLREKFRNKKTENKWVDYNKYQRIFPKWTITPDATSGDSLYWMLFIGKYKDQIAKHFDAESPIVPESWSEIEWVEVEANLKKLYN